ncbi:MAG: GntR family transcriptional regulator [Arcobacter sp.]|uniref:DoxX family protein n=1 Tax=uncultured Arcobacter sp. TaxID=165434 RepID=UPI000CA96F07|nr:DoxX family protein [uncultured Arcobacter sp.]PLY09286.1 MAG: GntR family transcriptional regulator [Arcobacter sp.]
MNSSYNENFAKLFLRLFVGILFLLHGYAKLKYGTSFIESVLEKNNLPQYLVYGVYIGEVIAPIFLIIGYYTKTFSLIIIINILFAIYLVHPSEIFSLSSHGGLALELQYFYIFTSLLIILIGPGKFSLDEK